MWHWRWRRWRSRWHYEELDYGLAGTPGDWRTALELLMPVMELLLERIPRSVQLGPSPQTREYSVPPPINVPPAQWGDVYSRAGDDGCELFGARPTYDEYEALPSPQQAVQHPDELGDADFPPAPPQRESLVAARCVNGTLLRPGNAEEEPPSTACRTE